MNIYVVMVRNIWPNCRGDWHVEGVFSSYTLAEAAVIKIKNSANENCKVITDIETWPLDKISTI